MNYYRDMWSRRSHTLVHLTKITSSRVEFKWAKIEQDDFGEIKRILARNNLLAYPDFIEDFKIHTYASDVQLGAVIIRKGKPIAVYSTKLTDAYKMYTVTEKDKLIIFEHRKEFRTILLCQRLRIYIDHKNLTCNFFYL